MSEFTMEEAREIRQHRRDVRMKRAGVAADLLKKHNIPAIEQSRNVFRIDSDAGTIMYYPSSKKWQLKTKTFRGSFEAFLNFLKPYNIGHE